MVLENHEEIKQKLKKRYVTLKNAASKLNVDYKYLSQTLNGYESYTSVLEALKKANYKIITKTSRGSYGQKKQQ